MDLGAYQLQIFLSLFVILGAAFVALFCDLLQSNNEQLRVLNTELKLRCEKEQKRFDILLGERMESQYLEAEEETAVGLQTRTGSLQARAERKRAPAPEALAAMERGLQMAGLPRRRAQISENVATSAASPETAETSVNMVMERLVEQALENTYARGVDILAARAAAQAGAFQETPSTDMERAHAHSASGAGSRDWSSLLNRRAAAASSEAGRTGPAPRPDLLAAVVAATDSTTPQSSADSTTGFYDGFVLSRLMEGRQPTSGLVVSVSLVAQNEVATDSAPTEVRSLLESLMGQGDFAMQSGKEEYLLIYPGLRGTAAQRRLAEVREQLMDFAVRSEGQFEVQINWGGEETPNESIEEAIAMAAEHMSEMRPSRKPASMDCDVRAALPKAG